jgi:hypothetical protein
MLTPEHRLFQRQRLSVHRFRRLVQSLAIAASPLPAGLLESSHRFFDDWPITSIAEQ